jgi:hypothetical protein
VSAANTAENSAQMNQLDAMVMFDFLNVSAVSVVGPLRPEARAL